jgi:hypothetical protein
MPLFLLKNNLICLLAPSPVLLLFVFYQTVSVGQAFIGITSTTGGGRERFTGICNNKMPFKKKDLDQYNKPEKSFPSTEAWFDEDVQPITKKWPV